MKNKIENYKIFNKEQRKTIKNQKKMDQIEVIIIIGKKNHKLDLKYKIESQKKLWQKDRKRERLKVERLNKKTLYI